MVFHDFQVPGILGFRGCHSLLLPGAREAFDKRRPYS